jgi:putative ABC transport system permease protein
MRLSSIAHLYRVRLKARIVLVQELLAVLGLAVGVALLFASQVASGSLNGSVRQLTNGIVGSSQYQLQSRDSRGFDQRLLGEVQRLPGVSAAMPVLEERVSVIGPAGQRAVDLIAGDPRYVNVAGPLLRHFRSALLAHERALALPEPIARAIGAESLQQIKLQIGASVVPALLAATLQGSDIGPLVNSPVAVAPLTYAQQLTGMRGRITRIFVQARAGQRAEVHAGLVRLAANHLNVEPADFDATLFSQAAEPINQSTATFAAICALVGFMFAYCSMLLTMPLRQGLIRTLRRNGATRLETVKTLLFDALVLGCLACIVGLALGEAISLTVFHPDAGYLSFGFPIGSQRIVTWQDVAIAVAGGMLAAYVGVLSPVREIFSRPLRRVSDAPKRLIGGWTMAALVGGLASLAVTTIILFAAPGSSILAVATLVLALLLLLPVLLDLAVAAFEWLQRSWDGGWSRLAVVELRSPRTRTRSLAIAATGAVAVFGSVTIQGAQRNLQGGLDKTAVEMNDVTDLWVSPSGTANTLGTTPFPSSTANVLKRLPGVQAVNVYRGGFLDVGDRRVWVVAPPRASAQPIGPGQLTSGNFASATVRIRQGGWAIVSEAIADEAHLHIGESYTLPASNPTSFRIAGFSTNGGWPPGVIIINADDYARAWGSSAASALNITLARGVSPAQGRLEIARALPQGSGLTVQTAAERGRQWETISHQGLARLTQIATLVLIATVLAMSIAMGTMISQRHRRFARMKVQGYSTRVLWYALFCESALLLGTGALTGALFGIYGQLLLSHAMLSVTGFPVLYTTGVLAAIGSFALVTAVAAAIVAVPGYRVARVAPYPWSSA